METATGSRLFHKSNKSAEADLIADWGHPDPEFPGDLFTNPNSNMQLRYPLCNRLWSRYRSRYCRKHCETRFKLYGFTEEEIKIVKGETK